MLCSLAISPIHILDCHLYPLMISTIMHMLLKLCLYYSNQICSIRLEHKVSMMLIHFPNKRCFITILQSRNVCNFNSIFGFYFRSDAHFVIIFAFGNFVSCSDKISILNFINNSPSWGIFSQQ